MEGYFCEVLQAADPAGDAAQVTESCRDFITELTGRQTIYQAIELERRVNLAGARALPAAAYKQEYLRRLHARIEHRLTGLRDGSRPPEDFLVAGSIDLLRRLVAAGITCHLASGTDRPNVVEEAELLGLTEFFCAETEVRIHGALPDYENFSKRQVIERLVDDEGLGDGQFVGFGDGFVEIEETRRGGGIAVAIASREDGTHGMDPWKQQRLTDAGAQLMVADWLDIDALLATLGVTGRRA